MICLSGTEDSLIACVVFVQLGLNDGANKKHNKYEKNTLKVFKLKSGGGQEK